MAKMRGAVVIDTERCKGCDLCVVAFSTQKHPRGQTPPLRLVVF